MSGKKAFQINLDDNWVNNTVTNLSLGLLRPSGNITEDLNRQNAERGKREYDAFVASVTNDVTLDAFTRNELLSGLTRQNLKDKQAYYETAKKGELQVFKDRKAAEEEARLLTDQPGRKQVFSGAVDNGVKRNDALLKGL